MYRSDKQFMKNPATAPARIYVGAIADGVVASDLEELFEAHGKILGLMLQKGFGFVQFENEAQAQSAIRSEHGKMFHGRKLNVKQAMDKSRGNTPQIPPPTLEKKVSIFEKPSGPQPPKLKQVADNQEEKMETDIRDEIVHDKRDLENDPFAMSEADSAGGDRKWNNRRGGWQNQPMGGGRAHRDNFGPGHRGEGPFRGRGDIGEGNGRGEFGRGRARDGDGPQFFPRDETFCDRPGPVFIPPPGLERPERNDCEIIVVSKALTEYAEFIEQKLKSIGLVVDLLFPNEDVPIGRVLANISSRGCLYAILIMPQNEEFRSLTLNILHGIPQEHRNMPVEDALILMGRNFDAYMRGEKPGSAALNSVSAMLSERHPEAIQILCNLLAENRQVTTAQYDRLIKYLQEKRDLQSQYEIAESGAELNADGEPNTKQAELQNRIMNILNKSSDEPSKLNETQTPPPGPTPLLNDPSVQKALDSLLSGDMFKNINPAGF